MVQKRNRPHSKMKNKLRPLKFSWASFPTPSTSVRRRRNASRTSPGTEETSSQTSCFVSRMSIPSKTDLLPCGTSAGKHSRAPRCLNQPSPSITGEGAQIQPPHTANPVPDAGPHPRRRRCHHQRPWPKTTASSCTTPNQIAKIAVGVSLTGFIDAEGATNAKRNPGEDYSTTHGEAAVRRP